MTMNGSAKTTPKTIALPDEIVTSFSLYPFAFSWSCILLKALLFFWLS